MLQSTHAAADAAVHALSKAHLPVPAHATGAHDISLCCSRSGALVAHTVAVAAAAQEWARMRGALACYALVSEVNACQPVQLSPALTSWRLAIATRARRPGCPSSFKLIASQVNSNSSFLTATPAINLIPYCFPVTVSCVVCCSEMTCGND